MYLYPAASRGEMNFPTFPNHSTSISSGQNDGFVENIAMINEIPTTLVFPSAFSNGNSYNINQ